MRRVVRLKLIASFNRAGLVDGVNLYEDCANLTRLDDFIKVKVAWLASSRCRWPRSHPIDQSLIPRMKDGVARNALKRTLIRRQRRFLRKLERLRSCILNGKILFKLLAGKNIAEIALRQLNRYNRAIAFAVRRGRNNQYKER